jgi:CRP-like cAMP-binding protein
VAWCLSRVARQEGTLDRGGILIPKKAHQELAEMAGCSRETVTRALSALKRKKCVSWSGKTMRLEIEALQRYVRAELHVPGVQR